MIETIKGVLQDISSTNPNLQSESTREMIARLIESALKSKDDFGVDEYPYTSDFGKKEQEDEKLKWVCDICGKNTFEVDWDYIGSGYNHLSCDFEAEQLNLKVQSDSPHNDGWTRKHYADKLSDEYSDEVYNGHKDKLSEEITSNSLGYIFESPDGGETVFKRKFGERERELITKEDWKQYNRNR